MRAILLLFVLTSALVAQTPAPQHDANFDAERKQANDLFVAGKILESLPLYEDLCRQDQTVAVFAERHGAGLIQKSATLTGAAQQAMQEQGIAEIRRAQKLGDNSAYVQQMLSVGSKTPLGAVLNGVPLTVGYTYQGSPEAQAALKEAEAAFGRQEYPAAVKLYQKAAALDPKWYAAPLYTGDAYFRMQDYANAGVWYQKAVAIDPDRETAYRYWADALTKAGDQEGAKAKVEQAIIAEPYAKAGWLALQQWGNLTKTALSLPRINRPDFKTQNGVLQPDSSLATDTGNGMKAWLVYENCRVKHGGMTLNQTIVAGASAANGQLTPSGYRHSLAEEGECLRATALEVRTKIIEGTLIQSSLDPSLQTLLALDKTGLLDCWIVLNAADAGIRYDYPAYRKEHREKLTNYVERYIIKATPTQ